MTNQTHSDDSGLNILVVEDNPADSKMLVAFLRQADGPLNVKIVTDGEEAIRYLMRTGEYQQAQIPDVVLLDINLPKKNGFEVLAEVRQEARIADLPVFVISSSSHPEDLRRGQALNIAGYFEKPTDLKDFERLADALTNEEFPKHVPAKFKVVRGDAHSPHEVRLKENPDSQPAQSARPGDELFRQLVESVKDYAIFMLDAHGTILTWNEGAERLKGYRAADVIGKNFSIFYPEEALRRHHPAHELEVAAGEGRFEEEGWRIRKDGSRFWANVTITAIRNKAGELIGYGKVTRDFSERLKADVRLRESERRFRLLIEGVQDYAIFMLNPDGTIASWNVGAERIKGYKASEILGKHFSVFYTKDAIDKNHPQHELRIATEHGVYEEEGLRVRKDGSTFWSSVVITALRNEKGIIEGFAKVTRDVTERKRAEAERETFSAELEEQVRSRTRALDESRRELIQHRDQLLRSNTDLQQFAYVASHDLQEPLRGIVTCHQMLEKEFAQHITPEMKEYMDLAIHSGLRMKALIEGLLEYARMGHNLHLTHEVDFNVLVADVVLTLQPLIQSTGAKVEVGPLPSAFADSPQMGQVFLNLIANGIKYGSGKKPVIRVTAARRDADWLFRVSDNGMGISSQYFDRIFAIFQRLHSNRGEHRGTGIGLAICKKVVEAHHGKIWVEASTLGQGTTFSFSLPDPA